MISRFAIPAAMALALAGCTGTAAPLNPAVAIQQFTLKDVQNALADAQANHDTVAATCYAALATAIQAQSAGTAVPVSGALSVFQKLRDLQQGAQVGLPALNVPCAPLVLDTQQTLVKLGLLAGGAAVAIPLAPVLGPALAAVP